MKFPFCVTRKKHSAFFGIVSLLPVIAPLWLMLAAANTSAHAQTYKQLYNFGSHSGDPTAPRYSGIIAQGRDGYMYSTANDEWTDGLGTAFKMSPSGVLTVLHRFSGPDGLAPVGGLTLGTDGNFYGTSIAGGTYSLGTIFRMTPDGTVTTLYSFKGQTDGSGPTAPPIQGFDGSFYGTAAGGPACTETGASDFGSVYRITSTGQFTVLHTFAGIDGANPCGPLVQGLDSALYGTTSFGGSHGDGTIFRITSSGEYRVLFNFDGTHGRSPATPLIRAGDGNLHGDTTYGGSADSGVVFRITPGGSLTVLHNISEGSNEGRNQAGGLMLATDGNFYGTNNLEGAFGWGVLFRMTPSGAFSVLHNFDWEPGASPQAPLLQHTNGVLYGTTKVGGINNGGDGTFYSLDVGAHPFVSFLPEAGKSGDTVEILGQGFTGTSAVSFNGITAAFTVVSDTYLTAIVPLGVSQGTITVTTPGGTFKSNRIFLNKSADLFLRVTPSTTTVHQGDLLTFAFPVWNLGPDIAEGEVLSNLQVPAGTTFDYVRISGTPGLGKCTTPPYGGTGQILCHEGDGMAPNTTWTVRLTVKVTAAAGSTITANAATMADTPDPNLANNMATVSVKVQ